ncbi:MAG: DUF5017 domain-containing protein [Paludibacter sp.]|nr:DUF5017 domain-containing protein [Paludibacter sp.]
MLNKMTYNILKLFMLTGIFSACSNDIFEDEGYQGGFNPVDKTFSITTSKSDYKVGEIVKFMIKGDADSIIVYTGDEGHNYSLKESREIDLDYFITFETQSQDGTQQNQMKILISKDFQEDYTINGVHATTWTDITSEFTMAPPSNGTAYVPSGNGIFTSLLDQDKAETKMYFAVKQNVLNQTLHGKGNLNRLRSFSIKRTYGAGDELLSNHNDLGWTLFSTPNKQPDRASLSDNVITMRDSWQVAYFENDTEDWAVSRSFLLPRQKEIAASTPVVLKGDPSEGKVGNYNYVYKSVGHFDVVFVAVFDKGKVTEREELINISLNITE